MAVATDAVTFSYNTETVTFSNLGPLTTAFSPPPNCIASQTGTFQFISTASTYWDCAALTPVPGTPGELDFKYLEEPSCMPYGSEASSLWVAPSNFYQTLFSPGIACPSGWDTSAVVTYAPSATGTSIGVSGAGQWASFLTDAMPTGGTQVFCCPSSWLLQSLSCTSQITTSTYGVICDLTCNSTSTTEAGTPTNVCPYTTSGFDWAPSQTASALGFIVGPVIMVHQQSDLPSNNALSTDAKIAIGVVVPVVVILALLLGVYLAVRRRKLKQRSTAARLDPHLIISGHDDSTSPPLYEKPKLGVSTFSEPRYEDSPVSPPPVSERDVPKSPESGTTGGFEIHRTTETTDTERSADATLQGARVTNRHAELEDTGMTELGFSTRSANEVPSPLQPGRSSPEILSTYGA